MSNLNNGGLTRVLNYIKTWVNGLLSGKSDTSHTHTKSQITDFPSLSTVATSGSYSDLSNKPTIPTNTNQLTNGAGYLSGTVGISNGGTGATTRLEAAKNLTNENVGTSTQYFFTLTENWGKVGYASVADAKSVLGVPTNTNQLTNGAGFITSSGSCNYANYSGYVQGDRSTGLYVNSVKYGNALVTTNQSNFGSIWNAPTKNYRVACAVWTNNNDDVYLCYSVSNANVSSSTNSVTQDCVWNASDGTLRSTNIKATSGLYYNSYRIYVG